MTDYSDLVKRLRGKKLNCICAAKSASECCCNTYWPESSCSEAADAIEELTAENEKLKRSENELLAAIADALKTTVWMSDVINNRCNYNKYNFKSKLDVFKSALITAKHDIRVPLLEAISEIYGQETRNRYQCQIDDVPSRHAPQDRKVLGGCGE
jgi:hypothetical protein